MGAGHEVVVAARGWQAWAGGPTAQEQRGGGPVLGRRERTSTWATHVELGPTSSGGEWLPSGPR
jgi:hypothetical protein